MSDEEARFSSKTSTHPSSSPGAVVADDRGLQKRVPADRLQKAVENAKGSWRRILLNGSRPEPLPSYLGTVEDPVEDKLGICCSGGGIRSAAFSLGALQVLAREGELGKACYLAAVSGGAYIAAAISMVNKKGAGDSNPDLFKGKNDFAFAPGSPEEQYLRNRCSYLAPSWSDKVFLGIRVVLGLLLNLLFLAIPLVGLGLIATGLLYAPLLPSLAGKRAPEFDFHLSLPESFVIVPLAILGLSLLAGLLSMLFRWQSEEWERFLTTWATRLLLGGAALAVLLVGVPYLVEWLRDHSSSHSTNGTAGAGATGIGAGALALLAGVVAQVSILLRSKAVREEAQGLRDKLVKLGSSAKRAIAYLAGGLVGPLLLFLIFGAAVAAAMTVATRHGGVYWPLVWKGAVLLGLFAGFYAVADLTTWSLHPYYKRRLSSAFALKRIEPEELKEEWAERFEAVEPSPRGIAVERDFEALVPISDTALKKGDGAWPTLLICAAANISDTAATPPGRGVTSFTFSAHSAGGPLVGGIEMSALEHAFGDEGETGRGADGDADEGIVQTMSDMATARQHRRHDLSLMAAVAMSGAAISPSMGKMTSKPLRFLMTLANIRLGVWIPNPRWVARDGEKTVPSRPRPSYLLREFFGMNSVAAKYLYVTDGGHYENLGLVELLRRGCTQIYCLDASGVGEDGAEFGALGEAIALARSELGVEIEFDIDQETGDPKKLVPDSKTHLADRDAITATIKFPPLEDGRKGPEGTLIYARNTMTAKAAWDVRAHNEADPRFPNNPTVDQLYTDQKFEAYRVLGSLAGASAVEAMNAARGTISST